LLEKKSATNGEKKYSPALDGVAGILTRGGQRAGLALVENGGRAHRTGNRSGTRGE
jgi:hypothetical protein